jgi:hypothetical protein
MKYYKRGFLNRGIGMAAFEACVDITEHERACIDATFSITDCNRKVSLDFGVWEDDYDDVMFKLKLLQDELKEFEHKMIEAKVQSDINKVKFAEKKKKEDEDWLS